MSEETEKNAEELDLFDLINFLSPGFPGLSSLLKSGSDMKNDAELFADFSPEVKKLLEPNKIDYRKQWEKEVGLRTRIQQESQLLENRLKKIVEAFAEETAMKRDRFAAQERRHAECHKEWQSDKSIYEITIGEQAPAIKSMEEKLSSLTQRLEAGEEIPYEKLIEELNCIQDFAVDARNNIGWRIAISKGLSDEKPLPNKEVRRRNQDQYSAGIPNKNPKSGSKKSKAKKAGK